MVRPRFIYLTSLRILSIIRPLSFGFRQSCHLDTPLHWDHSGMSAYPALCWRKLSMATSYRSIDSRGPHNGPRSLLFTDLHPIPLALHPHLCRRPISPSATKNRLYLNPRISSRTFLSADPLVAPTALYRLRPKYLHYPVALKCVNSLGPGH